MPWRIHTDQGYVSEYSYSLWDRCTYRLTADEAKARLFNRKNDAEKAASRIIHKRSLEVIGPKLKSVKAVQCWPIIDRIMSE